MRKLARYPSLEGASAFVTGGATGIGEAIVRSLAAQGARITFVDVLAEAGGSVAQDTGAHFIQCDLRDIDALRRAIREARDTNGPLSALVSNAADDTRHSLSDLTPAFWDERININLRPMAFAAQEVAPQMRARGGGAIVNLSSISWKIADAGYVAYATAKAAVHGLTRSLARELGPDNIRVNTLTPGWVMTERQKRLWVTANGERAMDQGQCLKARLQPEDIAAMAMFLCAEDSRFCTAQDFTVDAGWS